MDDFVFGNALTYNDLPIFSTSSKAIIGKPKYIQPNMAVKSFVKSDQTKQLQPANFRKFNIVLPLEHHIDTRTYAIKSTNLFQHTISNKLIKLSDINTL